MCAYFSKDQSSFSVKKKKIQCNKITYYTEVSWNEWKERSSNAFLEPAQHHSPTGCTCGYSTGTQALSLESVNGGTLREKASHWASGQSQNALFLDTSISLSRSTAFYSQFPALWPGIRDWNNGKRFGLTGTLTNGGRMFSEYWFCCASPRDH